MTSTSNSVKSFRNSTMSQSKKLLRKQSTSSSIMSGLPRAIATHQNVSYISAVSVGLPDIKSKTDALVKAAISREVDAVDPFTGEVRMVKPLSNTRPRAGRGRERGSAFTSGQVTPTSGSQSDLFSERISMGFGSESISRTESAFSGSSDYSFLSEEDFMFSRGEPMSLDDALSASGHSESSTSDYGYDSDAHIFDSEGEDESQRNDDILSKQEKDDDPYGGLAKKNYEMLMEREFSLTLKETPTIFLLENYDRAVASDAYYLPEVKEKNEQYLRMKNKIRENSDRYIGNSSQTLNMFSKNKYTNTETVEMENSEANVKGYEIYDEYERMREEEEREREEREQMLMSAGSKKNDEEEDEETEGQLTELDDENEDGESSTRTSAIGTDILKQIIKKPHFKELLITTERTIVQNQFKEAQEEYKTVDPWNINLQPIEHLPQEGTRGNESHSDNEWASESDNVVDTDEEEDDSQEEDEKELSTPIGEFKTLWNSECSLTEGLETMCMAWNPENEDILASGYSNIIKDAEGSTILCWTIKNPTYPERVFQVPNLQVTSVDFSAQHPSLLAAGFSDGTVNVYDVRRSESDPVLESLIKHHNGTVWGLQWVDRGQDVGERLRSVGADGRVNSWSIKKGLDCQELMRLKPTSSGTETTSASSLILRESGGLCIDTDPTDHSQYIVGTEDGPIYKCSASYNEHYLETYYGHTGPVYRVRWDPFDHSRFVSCSADWTIRIWDQENTIPYKTIEVFSTDSMKKSSAVTDVAWSNVVPGIIGATTITGHVDLWDISNTGSTVRPRFRATRGNSTPTTLLFARKSHAMLVGFKSGTIEVMKPKLYSPE